MSDEAVSGSRPSEEAEGGKKPAAVWRVFSADEVRKVAADLVHFSVKTVNSNAAACGVRLGPDAIEQGTRRACLRKQQLLEGHLCAGARNRLALRASIYQDA